VNEYCFDLCVFRWNQQNITHPSEFTVKDGEPFTQIVDNKHGRTFVSVVGVFRKLNVRKGMPYLTHQRGEGGM